MQAYATPPVFQTGGGEQHACAIDDAMRQFLRLGDEAREEAILALFQVSQTVMTANAHLVAGRECLLDKQSALGSAYGFSPRGLRLNDPTNQNAR